MPTAGLKTIIALSFVLAVGFLLVILSCALFSSYLPLLVVGTYVIAPIPNWICSRCANPDDFVESSGAAVLDLGRFFTGFLVVMGIGGFSIKNTRNKTKKRKKRKRRREKWKRNKNMTKTIVLYQRWLTILTSSPHCPRPFGSHPRRSHDHVDSRRVVDLRNHHQLRHVLSGRAGILTRAERFDALSRWQSGLRGGLKPPKLSEDYCSREVSWANLSFLLLSFSTFEISILVVSTSLVNIALHVMDATERPTVLFVLAPELDMGVQSCFLALPFLSALICRNQTRCKMGVGDVKYTVSEPDKFVPILQRMEMGFAAPATADAWRHWPSTGHTTSTRTQ